MGRNRRFDFTLFESKHSKLIFRFYPKYSHCHSFDEVPPKSWDEVYKVYYSYSIIKHYKNDIFELPSEVMFSSGCDECSAIDEVAVACDLIVMGHKSITRTWNDEEITIELLNRDIYPTGDGVTWKISEIESIKSGNVQYEITLFRFDGVGYKFYLDKDKLGEFGSYLNDCCEYMLAHGEPI